MKFWNVHHSNKIRDVRLTPHNSTVSPNSKIPPKIRFKNFVKLTNHIYAFNSLTNFEYLQTYICNQCRWSFFEKHCEVTSCKGILGGFKPFWKVNSCAVLGRQQGICIQVQTCSRVGGSSSSRWRRRMCRSSLVIVVNQTTTHQIPE